MQDTRLRRILRTVVHSKTRLQTSINAAAAATLSAITLAQNSYSSLYDTVSGLSGGGNHHIVQLLKIAQYGKV